MRSLIFAAAAGVLLAGSAIVEPAAAADCSIHPVADTSAASNTAFYTAFAAQQGVVKRPSGLLYCAEKSGSGRTPKPDDIVRVTYVGQLVNGAVFDQTQPGQIAEFPAGRLIKGWVEALSLMKEGDRWVLVIPADLAYGHKGAGAAVPADQTLVFTMELIAIK